MTNTIPKSWEIIVQNRKYKDKLRYEVTTQTRLDIDFFKSWITDKETNFSFLRVKNFRFRNIAVFLFIPYLIEDKDYNFPVYGPVLRLIGTRDIYNLYGYINSGLGIFPTSSIGTMLYFKYNKRDISHSPNLRFQHLKKLKGKDCPEQYILKDQIRLLTHFSNFEQKSKMILKKKLQSISLNMILWRILEVYNNLRHSVKTFKLDYFIKLKEFDFILNFYLKELRNFFCKKKRFIVKVFTKPTSFFFFSNFNLLKMEIPYILNRFLCRIVIIRKRRFYKYKKRKKIINFKFDLPRIETKVRYVHPFKIGRMASFKQIKTLMSLGRKKFISWRSRLNSFNNNSLTNIHKASWLKEKIVVPFWKKYYRFYFDINNWSEAKEVYIKDSIRFYRSHIVKERLNVKKTFRIKMLNVLIVFQGKKLHRSYKNSFQPEQFMEKFKRLFYQTTHENYRTAYPIRYVKWKKQLFEIEVFRGLRRKYEKAIWNPDKFDLKFYRHFNLEAIYFSKSFYRNFYAWPYRIWKIGSLLLKKNINKKDLNYKNSILYALTNFKKVSRVYLNKLLLRNLKLSAFLNLLNDTYKTPVSKKLFWATPVSKIKRRRVLLVKAWFNRSKMLRNKAFYFRFITNKDFIKSQYDRHRVFVNSFYDSIRYQQGYFRDLFKFKSVSGDVVSLRHKFSKGFEDFYVKVRKIFLRNYTTRDQFILILFKFFYFYRYLNHLYLTFNFWLKSQLNENNKQVDSKTRRSKGLTIFQLRRWNLRDSSLDRVYDLTNNLLTKKYLNKNELVISVCFKTFLFFINTLKIRRFSKYFGLSKLFLLLLLKILNKFFTATLLWDSIYSLNFLNKKLATLDERSLVELTSISVFNNWLFSLTGYNSRNKFARVWPYNIHVSRLESIVSNIKFNSGYNEFYFIPWRFSKLYSLRKLFITFSFIKSKLKTEKFGFKFITKASLNFSSKKFVFLKCFEIFNSVFYIFNESFNFNSFFYKNNPFYFKLFLNTTRKLKK